MSEPLCRKCGWPERNHPMHLEPEPAVCETFAPATPLPAPDPKARDRSYWRKVVKDAYDLHQFPIGFEETQARLDAMARDLDDAHSAAPHGEAVTAPHAPNYERIVIPAPAARVTIDDRFILAVEEEVGMGNGAWDMVPATALCEAVLKVAALSARTGGTE
jgi:hypothetical protein